MSASPGQCGPIRPHNPRGTGCGYGTIQSDGPTGGTSPGPSPLKTRSLVIHETSHSWFKIISRKGWILVVTEKKSHFGVFVCIGKNCFSCSVIEASDDTIA